ECFRPLAGRDPRARRPPGARAHRDATCLQAPRVLEVDGHVQGPPGTHGDGGGREGTVARPIGSLTALHRVTPAVALTAPFAHPYVRRGAERYVHDLARWLLDHDREVTIVATCPDASRITTD